MIKHFKNLSNLKGKKRYLVIGFLALELMSLPAAAKIAQTVSFTPPPIVTAVEIPTAEPGLSRYLVMSDAEFVVNASHMTGDVDVNVFVSGNMGGGVRFGDAAQLPGAKVTCATITDSGSKVYDADRTTAARPGTVPDQAVVFEFAYAPESRPQFEFIAGDVAASTLTNCDETNI